LALKKYNVMNVALFFNKHRI